MHPSTDNTATDRESDHAYWSGVLKRIAEPVLKALAQRQLKLQMPIEIPPSSTSDRRPYSHLEAFGRTLAGITPWLACPQSAKDESERLRFVAMACEGLDAATDPRSPDYMNFNQGSQPLVDAAFLAQALLRAPKEIYHSLNDRVKHNVQTAMAATRVIVPPDSNWLWFSAMIEAFFCSIGQSWRVEVINHAVNSHLKWYKGDGVYGDGPGFHWDYYNSFVIQPMMIEVLEAVGKQRHDWDAFYAAELVRGRRYAAVLERMISPEGTFPVMGRSISYRFGALQMLALMALRRNLPSSVSPGQVRSAMTAVIRRMIEAPGTFDAKGFLRIGFCGSQPNMGERYISTGSQYLCTVGLLPLGLPPTDEFWTCGFADWTSRRAWAGSDVGTDHAIAD